ncbi:ABC-three component system middle component 2 [Lentzea sp. NPDC051213]|uniref:ABC-three component system middle component 2 n=1 Tax=Lentzea sp. NPDC051213 TaxID=3364126 RepID=UPI0037BA9D25
MTTPHVLATGENDSSPVVVPEDDVIFRLAQLLLLLTSLQRLRQPGISLERLGCYDFLVANPLLVVTYEDDADRKRLLMAGFDGRALIYASPAHRFTTRRERLQHDLALLVAYGLVAPTVDKSVLYAVTPSGVDLAGRFTAVYAKSYRLSAEIIIRRLARLSDTRLREAVRTWTTVGYDAPRPEALDLLDAVDLLHDHQAAETWTENTVASSPTDGQPT